MYSSLRLSFVLGFSLLVLPALLADQASAQTVELTSLEPADCTNNSSTKTECTSNAESANAVQSSGSTRSLTNLTQSPGTALQLGNQGSFLISTNPFNGLFKTEGIGAIAQAPATTWTFGNSDRYTNKSALDRISERVNQPLLNSRLMQLPIGTESLPDYSKSVKEEGAIANLLASSGDGILPNASTKSIDRILPDSSTVPTAEILSNSATEPIARLVPNSSGVPIPGIIPTPSIEPTADNMLADSDPLELSASELISGEAKVPEPSISLLTWLGLAAIGLLPTRLKIKK
jgi:hypothetical protein